MNYDINEILADIRSARKKKVIFDTDAYNEIDDQFAIAYVMKARDRLEILGMCAAPFCNGRSNFDPDEGMVKSYDEIFNIMAMTDKNYDFPVFMGSRRFLQDEKTYEDSPAADFIIKTALESDERIYVLAIGAITNVASALLKCPQIKDKIVVVWIGTNAKDNPTGGEFNMNQDIASGRVLLDAQVPVMLVPVNGVITRVGLPKAEILGRLTDKNELCTYLRDITAQYHADEADDRRITLCDIMCITAMYNNEDVDISIENSPVLGYDRTHSYEQKRHQILLVNSFKQESVYDDLFEKLYSAGK